VALSKEKKLGISIVVGIVAVLVLQSMGLRQYICEVCITYQGRTNCAVATGRTKKEAQGSAINTACGPISGGVTQSIQCSNTPPDKVTWLD
jgi:hypothetical protein|tara:strand:- start:454 stop:726 length:273 start_codon:yes stop_codon:yes gene_type:complete